MKIRYLFYLMLYIPFLLIDFSYAQSIKQGQRFNDRLKEINYDENLSGRYVYQRTTNLDSFIIAKMDQYHIPGLAASIVRNDEIIWTGTYGFANIEDSIEVTDTTLFMLASVSKTVTAVALMKLWEVGRFGLDDDINNYLPFEVHNPNFPDSVITFRMLLSHTSSIRDNWGEMPYWSGDSPIPLGQYLEDYLVPGGAYYHSINYYNYSPATNFNYSNIAVALAGYLVEEIAGNFSTFCQDSIFTPLGMSETSWFLEDLDTNNIAIPYSYSGGTYQAEGFYGYSDYPAGQLRTSSLQLSRFLIAFMQDGVIDTVRILDSATVSLMTTIQYPEIDSNQGLIWYKKLVDSRWIWGHTGGDLGVNTNMFFSQSEGSGAIFLANRYASGFQNNIIDALFDYAAPVISISENVDNLSLPNVVNIHQNYPNPFNPITTLRYDLPERAEVTLTIYDILGRKVRTLVHSIEEPGIKSVEWDGTNDLGEQMSTGVYLYRIQAGDFTQTRKMVLLR